MRTEKLVLTHSRCNFLPFSRCQDCHWPVSVGDRFETLECGYCEEVVEEEIVQKYFKLKETFLATNVTDFESSQRFLHNMFSVFHPYDLHFIALSQAMIIL